MQNRQPSVKEIKLALEAEEAEKSIKAISATFNELTPEIKKWIHENSAYFKKIVKEIQDTFKILTRGMFEPLHGFNDLLSSAFLPLYFSIVAACATVATAALSVIFAAVAIASLATAALFKIGGQPTLSAASLKISSIPAFFSGAFLLSSVAFAVTGVLTVAASLISIVTRLGATAVDATNRLFSGLNKKPINQEKIDSEEEKAEELSAPLLA